MDQRMRVRMAPIELPVDVDTPALVVDRERMTANVERMATLARNAGVALRPHAKTHKSPPIGCQQVAHGAAGLTVATLAEAEAFAAGGCDDLFIAYPMWAGHGRAARVRALHERIRLAIGVDSTAGADALARAVRGAPDPLDVLVELDCGGRRTGIDAAAAGELAGYCLRLGLNVRGAFTHPGHAYAHPAATPAAAADERDALATAGAALTRLLGRPPVLSGGSTPTTVDGVDAPLTEIRPGTYVFGDRQQTVLTGLPVEQIALVVAARVVSVPRPGEAVLDAGSKALSGDRPEWLSGYGLLPQAPGATIDAITEEHAVVRGLERPVAVGDLVGVVPNHVCSAVNLGREILVVSAGVLVDTWPIASRTAR
ncbi:alanine racemase [Plantactinospora sp. B6F1]|uniref:alanine racemase n=1 Tax=Plantactinospora sp. B6F1 TaxID=3158971 RepID=UPI0032D931C6